MIPMRCVFSHYRVFDMDLVSLLYCIHDWFFLGIDLVKALVGLYSVCCDYFYIICKPS